MYQALYRKWRPMTFDQVIGQEHITETLKNQVRTGRLSHAYIFIGTRGTGKTTCARILARAVNCEHPVNGNPCGECPACRGILDGSVMDVVELDAASNNGVDNVRALRDEAVFSPAAVRRRVYIIDEVHMLSTPAFNALLKILEEPPEHLMFILATTELQKVPATILSRCQRHSFKRIESARLADHLQYVAAQEKLNVDRGAAELMARLADGGVRDALSLLDQCSGMERIDAEAVYSAIGLAGNRRIAQLLDGILAHDTAGVLKLYNALWMDGKDPVSLLGEISGLLRDVLMVHVAPKSAAGLISGGYELAALKSFAERMTSEEILCALSMVQERLGAMRDVKNPGIAAELCLVSLCDSTTADSVAALRARISRLEEQMRNAPPARLMPEEADEFPEAAELFPPRRDEPIEEELDPAMFAEEQPEDDYVNRYAPATPTPTRDEAPVSAPAVSSAPPASPAPAVPSAGVAWKDVLDAACPTLPRDIQLLVSDGRKVRGTVEGNVLRIEAEAGFVYGRLNRQTVLQKLSQAAATVAGHEINALLSERRPDDRETRSLDELKQFKEVKFI